MTRLPNIYVVVYSSFLYCFAWPHYRTVVVIFIKFRSHAELPVLVRGSYGRTFLQYRHPILPLLSLEESSPVVDNVCDFIISWLSYLESSCLFVRATVPVPGYGRKF